MGLTNVMPAFFRLNIFDWAQQSWYSWRSGANAEKMQVCLHFRNSTKRQLKLIFGHNQGKLQCNSFKGQLKFDVRFRKKIEMGHCSDCDMLSGIIFLYSIFCT